MGATLIQYTTSQQSPSPAYQPFQRQSPYKFPGSHEDVYNLLSAKNAAGIAAQRDNALVDFSNERMAAQQAAALTGLQNLSKQRQDMAELADRRAGIGMGVVNSVLSGLFN